MDKIVDKIVDRSSLFLTRWQCLNLVKGDVEDFVPYAGGANRECKKFKLNEITLYLFKCLIFVQSLTDNEDAEIRPRILAKLKMVPRLILQKIAEECQCSVNIKLDTTRNEERDTSPVHNVLPL